MRVHPTLIVAWRRKGFGSGWSGPTSRHVKTFDGLSTPQIKNNEMLGVERAFKVLAQMSRKGWVVIQPPKRSPPNCEH
jgi:hypothetical protein